MRRPFFPDSIDHATCSTPQIRNTIKLVIESKYLVGSGHQRCYIVDRRHEPREDVLTELALAKYPDGLTPEVMDVIHLSTFLFTAGMETTTKLLTAGMRVLGERPDIQALVREDRSRIPAFLEETLRMESPVKSHFRLARHSTTVGDVPIAAGTTMMLLPGACNRDPSKFAEPQEFRIDRPNVREHVAFGRGNHSCRFRFGRYDAA